MSPPLIQFLAQPTPQHDTGDVYVWALVLIIFIIALFGVVVVFRKWMNREETTSGPGFTLSDFRRLHKEGKMTDEEYEKAKAILIGSVKAAMDKPKEGPKTDPDGFDVLPPDGRV
jgi:hypothetical protein